MLAFKKSLYIIIINLALLIGVFFIGEVTCRITGIPYKNHWTPKENAFARFDPELGWSYIPNKSTIHIVGSGEDSIKNPVHFDENGIRTPYAGFKFNYSRPSILFIGCSITMGHGLSYEENFVGRFGAFDEVKSKYQVVNLGVQGYGSDQALLTLKRYIDKFNTKIVIYTFFKYHLRRNGNYDRRQIIPGARFLGTKPLFALNDKGELYIAKKPKLYKYYDYTHSWLFDLYKIYIGKKRGTFPPQPKELTRAIIQEMKEISNEHGAYFLILDWRWSEEDEDLRFLKGLNIDIIDTLKNAPPNWEKMVIFGGVHPDAEASKHVAQLLLEYFRKKDLLSPENPS
jgi:hypothetical protein